MKSTKNKTLDIKSSPTDAYQPDRQNSSKELIKFHEVEDTPFTIINTEEKYMVMLGKYRLSDKYDTAEEAMDDAKRADWNRVMQVIGVMIEEYNNTKK